MRHSTKTITAMTLALSLAIPLAACGGQTTQNGDSVPVASEQTNATTASIDVSAWKTFGDALAAKSEDGTSTAAWDEHHYVTVFQAGDATVRVVVKMTPEVYAKIADLDASKDDYEKKFAEVVGGLELESAEDITGDQIPQDQLDAHVGKTGQDLLDAGFTFQSYYMNGGEETGATMQKGYFAYNVTFETTVDEDKTEDEGEAIKGATITAMECAGGADSAVDISAL
ncbi:MAG: hypothetical protein IKG22_04865 [Atopobiaceae bacterium]|nr:hypothetical protein [Atopobiaceae bacterium]